MSEHEENGAGGNEQPPFDHTELEIIGRAIIEAGRGLVSFRSDYPYLEPDEREISRQRFGRIVALINSLWPQMDAAIKDDPRPAIKNHERDAHFWHVDRVFNLMEAAVKKPPKDD